MKKVADRVKPILNKNLIDVGSSLLAFIISPSFRP
jgi:hypothetical protein